MQRHLTVLLAVASLAGVAAPAFAQPWDDDRGQDRRWEQRYDDRDDRWGGDGWEIVDRVERRIERAYDNGRITRWQHARLVGQLRQLEGVEHRYMRDGGLSRWERSDLQRRADWLQDQLREDRRDRTGYGR